MNYKFHFFLNFLINQYFFYIGQDISSSKPPIESTPTSIIASGPNSSSKPPGEETSEPPTMKTVTISYPPPTLTETCAVGTKSKPVAIPGTSYPGTTVTGSDNTVTVRPPTSFAPSTSMLPGCTSPGEEPTSPGNTGTSSGPTPPDSETATKTCPGNVCTCTPKPPVCMVWDIYKAFYCGEWVIYKSCSVKAFLGCGWDHIEKRDVDKENVPNYLVASTTTLTSLSEQVATAMADTVNEEKIVGSAVEDLKNKEQEVNKIMDVKDIDFSKIEKPQVLSKIDKLDTIKASANSTATEVV